MGISYSAILAIGKEFDEQSEAVQFLVDNGLATEEEIEEADGPSEWLYNHESLDGSMLNYCSGYGFYIGFDISVRSTERFAKDYTEGLAEWNKLFPDTPAEIVHTVMVS